VLEDREGDIPAEPDIDDGKKDLDVFG